MPRPPVKLARQLVRKVFSVYLALALAITAVQIALEYRETYSQVIDELNAAALAFEPGVTDAVWDYQLPLATSIARGAVDGRVVLGVRIRDMAGHINIDLSHDPSAQNKFDLSKVVMLFHTYSDGSREPIGEMVLYSSRSVVLGRVQYGVLLAFLTSLVKTAGLWLIIAFFANKLLSRPLRQLTDLVGAFDVAGAPRALPLELSAPSEELCILRDAFDDLAVRVVDDRVQLTEMAAALVQSARLALLGQMSAGITHEINQPLTALRALSDNSRQLLKIGRIDDVDRNLASITGLTERMARITKQLKAFAHKGSAVASPVQLHTAVSNMVELLSSRMQTECIDVNIDVPQDLRVLCEAYRLEQVLLNLFSNALDAMKASPTKRLSVKAQALGDRVLVKVSDTGTGISEAVLNRMFEPFFSTKASGEGLGLGLAISNSIVKEFGGMMRAMNVPNGAAFEFDLRRE